MWTAFVSLAAAGLAANVPFSSVPFAWSARAPWLPKRRLIASTACSGVSTPRQYRWTLGSAGRRRGSARPAVAQQVARPGAATAGAVARVGQRAAVERQAAAADALG